MTGHARQTDLPELSCLLTGADHVDVKTTESRVTLREFVAGALGWQPGWMRALFRARAVLARLLRLRHPDLPVGPRLRPEEIRFTPGATVWFFTVTAAAEDRFIVLEATDTHLTGYLAVVTEPVATGRNRFHAITAVRYHRWTGPLYFNLVRPFHHLVVRSMVAAGGAREPVGTRGPLSDQFGCAPGTRRSALEELGQHWREDVVGNPVPLTGQASVVDRLRIRKSSHEGPAVPNTDPRLRCRVTGRTALSVAVRLAGHGSAVPLVLAGG